jgi:hypothetical protein
MAFQLFQLEDEGALNRVIITIAAEIFLICATVLVLFAYVQPPIFISTAICLLVFFLGTILCWRSLATAQTIFMLSVLVTQFILTIYFDYLLIPFVLLDIVLVLSFARSWQPKDD